MPPRCFILLFTDLLLLLLLRLRRLGWVVGRWCRCELEAGGRHPALAAPCPTTAATHGPLTQHPRAQQTSTTHVWVYTPDLRSAQGRWLVVVVVVVTAKAGDSSTAKRLLLCCSPSAPQA